MRGNFKDHLNILSKLTLARSVNAAQVLGSFHRSRMLNRAEIKGLPISISIEPTTSCNLRCPECPSGLRSFTRPTGMLNQSLFEEAIGQLKDTLSYLTLYFQGEPYLNPAFLNMVKVASDHGIYTATSTNAHYLNDEIAKETVASGLDRLIISIDGITQETYESYRVGGSLDKVIEGAKNVVKWKRKLGSRTPYIIFQFLVVRQNEHEIKMVKDLARQIGIDNVVFKSAQLYDYKNGSTLMPKDPRYSRYALQNDGTYAIKNQLLNHCWKMWHSCVITWDGKIVPCCFDKDGQYVLGDLKQNSFRDIWYGKSYKEFRSTLLRARNEIEICKNCTEGTKVWV